MFFNTLLKKFSGRHYRRYQKRSVPIIARINEIEEELQGISDEELKQKTPQLKQRYRDHMDAVLAELSPTVSEEKRAEATQAASEEILFELLPEAFAVVKNTARRLCGQTISVCGVEMKWEMVHYDVQLFGGIALHENHISEMATGEGKTLVATLPLYLNALTGRNVQLVTTNDFLARRDAEWMGYIYNFLGLTVGCIQNQMGPPERREMYNRDITYGTASEFGFDYLRDNGMARRKEDQVQRDHYYVIIDEVDSILIDEARTPLIISGNVDTEHEAPYGSFKPVIARLTREQNSFCNRLMTEAKRDLDSLEDADESAIDRIRNENRLGKEKDEDAKGDPLRSALQKMLIVKMGAPRNKQFMRLMEVGKYRKLFEKYDLEMSGDFNKEKRYWLKEELFYSIEEKQNEADLTEKGRNFLRPNEPDAFVLPDLPTLYMEIDKDSETDEAGKNKLKAEAQEHFEKTAEEIHVISQLLRAYSLFEKDVDYVVQNGKVMIVDENTGRVMPGRRWGDGLHQAVEAKEGVTVEKESKTLATITIQNFFRLYDKLAGMTGTAETEANEFKDIYKLKVMVIPTHRPNQRKDLNDLIFKTRREKYNAVIEEIKEANGRGQPVLVGTVSVEDSEVLSRMLRRASIPHAVLNAKHHQQEAEIIARAGQRGTVTISTNMAGRGTDIKLGQGVPEQGGLYVLGTERHTSRRIDRQLRGRCARQGDPGLTRFYLSLEDQLLRLYGNSGFAAKVLESAFSEEGEALEHSMLNSSIEQAQKNVEQHHYSIRKRLLQYDEVLNNQREVIYSIRNDAIHSETPRDTVFELIEEELQFRLEESGLLDSDASGESLETYLGWVNSHFPLVLKAEEVDDLMGKPDDLASFTMQRIRKAYALKEEVENPDAMRMLERYVIISNIDRHWQNHLTEMEELKSSVGLRSYGQRDPLNEYKTEAFTYFDQMMGQIRAAICTGIFRSATNIRAFENMLAMLQRARASGPTGVDGVQADAAPQAGAAGGAGAAKAAAGAGSGRSPAGGGRPGGAAVQMPVTRPERRIGRNETVTIKRGNQKKILKYKKAEKMIESEGWQLLDND